MSIKSLVRIITGKIVPEQKSRTPLPQSLEQKASVFGKDWGLIGNIEESEVEAIVGAVSGYSKPSIALSAMQLMNIGYGYGKCTVQLPGKEPIYVEMHNAFGGFALDGDPNEIWISKGLSEIIGAKIGDTVVIKRTIDEEGRIKYECENVVSNPFGQCWGRISLPAEGIVAAIDSDGHNTEFYRVGLSAMQMTNLGIKRCSEPLNNQTITGVIVGGEHGFFDGQDYGRLVIEFSGKRVPVLVYNAFGMRAIGGCGIRVSLPIAKDLGLKLEDRVKIRMGHSSSVNSLNPPQIYGLDKGS